MRSRWGRLVGEARKLAVDVEGLLQTCVGIEDDGESVKLYVAGPTPERPASRGPARRSSLFHLLAGEQADTIRRFLASNPEWSFLKLGPAVSSEARGPGPAGRRRSQK
jgi:predicted membrane chloride channel (bestrophin family)